jgi:hypothetical protein
MFGTRTDLSGFGVYQELGAVGSEVCEEKGRRWDCRPQRDWASYIACDPSFRDARLLRSLHVPALN